MRGLIVGTGPSLREVLPIINRFDGLVFTCNLTFRDVRTDVWLSCDPSLLRAYGMDLAREVRRCGFDAWHWDASICVQYGYRYAEGVWMVDGKAYPRKEYPTPPGAVGGLWMRDRKRISLNHCSAAQLLNLAANQYGCSEIVLIGHDFNYPKNKPRHYFDNLSETPGEYPKEIRRFSKFDKKGQGDDLLQVYKRIAAQDGLPRIVNATKGSALPWFPMVDFEDFIT